MSVLDYQTKLPGYYPSAWTVECGGRRRQKLLRSAGPGFGAGTRPHHKISDAVVVDIKSGAEKGRAPTGAGASMGMFLCPGFDRDFHIATLPGMIASVFTG